MKDERDIVVTFRIPFGDGPGDVAAKMLRDRLHPILNTLGAIHPDITARVEERHMVVGWPERSTGSEPK